MSRPQRASTAVNKLPILAVRHSVEPLDLPSSYIAVGNHVWRHIFCIAGSGIHARRLGGIH